MLKVSSGRGNVFKGKGSLQQGTNRKGMKKSPWGGGGGLGRRGRGGGNGGDRDIIYSVKMTSMVEIYYIVKCRRWELEN